MTRAMKIGIVAAALMGLTIGAMFGVKEGIQFGRSLDEGELFFVSHATAEFAAKQFSHADAAHAREAAVLQIKVLQLLQRAGHDSSDELGWAYVRLAMIEESAGQKEAERTAFDRAKEYFRRSRPTEELTDDQMKSALLRMDEAMERARL